MVKSKLSRCSENIESDTLKSIEHRGMLISSGLITGEALAGIFTAIPIVVAARSDVLAFLGIHDLVLPGILILLIMLYVIYKVGAPNMKTGKE